MNLPDRFSCSSAQAAFVLSQITIGFPFLPLEIDTLASRAKTKKTL